ncbi:hypothetical protein BZB76_1845 [Actinomadura pelletieri DSM 43383]|uniref:Uncharacterized protein n=1 Tax=Actinomadura pelletieri DSM 43383 TaxID=1120940 RepID=A0A495QSK3_9ACTN|nr:hypothetical protein BZB76_1845 [Actinomadura pelletieri DSM 43383]
MLRGPARSPDRAGLPHVWGGPNSWSAGGPHSPHCADRTVERPRLSSPNAQPRARARESSPKVRTVKAQECGRSHPESGWANCALHSAQFGGETPMRPPRRAHACARARIVHFPDRQRPRDCTVGRGWTHVSREGWNGPVRAAERVPVAVGVASWATRAATRTRAGAKRRRSGMCPAWGRPNARVHTDTYARTRAHVHAREAATPRRRPGRRRRRGPPGRSRRCTFHDRRPS